MARRGGHDNQGAELTRGQRVALAGLLLTLATGGWIGDGVWGYALSAPAWACFFLATFVALGEPGARWLLRFMAAFAGGFVAAQERAGDDDRAAGAADDERDERADSRAERLAERADNRPGDLAGADNGGAV